MSYFNMDHAGWVQNQITATKRHKPGAAEKRAADDGRGWYAAPDILSPFQRRAFDILGIVGGGIYNAPIAWGSVHWMDNQVICAWGSCRLGTFDFQGLTLLVFLCHEARIRACVSPRSFQYVEIMLSERCAAGATHQRHPNLAEALEEWQQIFRPDHPIAFAPPKVDAKPKIFTPLDYKTFNTMKMWCFPLVKHGGETDKSFLVSKDGDSDRTFRLPKSQIMPAGEVGDKFFVTMIPSWLAAKHHLDPNTYPNLADTGQYSDLDRASFKAAIEMTRQHRNGLRAPSGVRLSDRVSGALNA